MVVIVQPACRFAGLLGDFVGELLDQAVGPHDAEGFDVGFARLAEDFDDDALGRAALVVGVFGEVDDDLVADLGVLGVGVADEDGLAEDAAVDLDAELVALLDEGAGVVLFGALDDLDDAADVGGLARLVAAAFFVDDAGLDLVAGDRVADAAGGDEQVAVLG